MKIKKLFLYKKPNEFLELDQDYPLYVLLKIYYLRFKSLYLILFCIVPAVFLRLMLPTFSDQNY